MYYLGNKHHSLTHIQLNYNELDRVFTIPERELLEGNLPTNKTKFVKA
jgi:hypothetical protein